MYVPLGTRERVAATGYASGVLSLVLFAVMLAAAGFLIYANGGIGPKAIRKTVRGESPAGRFYQRLGVVPRQGERPTWRFWAFHVLVFGGLTVLSIAIHKWVYTVIFIGFLVLVPILMDPDNPRRWRWQR